MATINKVNFLFFLKSIGPEMNVDDAVTMLQRHERARQGRLRAKLMLEIRRQENAEKNKGNFTLGIVINRSYQKHLL